MRSKLLRRKAVVPIALATLAGVSLFALGVPAIGQGNPESLLPEGFGDPVEQAPAQPSGPAKAAPSRTQPTGLPDIKLPSNAAETQGASAVAGVIEETGDLAASEDALAEKPATYEMPPSSLRRVDKIGRLVPANGGLNADAFGGLHGKYLMSLMHDMDAPIASRWASILLRRTLLSQINTPSDVNPADWVAERTALLLRMGEADAARALVQSVDVHRFTPKLLEVGADAALATADPAALCPLVQPALAVSKDPKWQLSEAICAALSGEAATATALIDRQKMRQGNGSIDVLLAEKVVGAGVNGRRAVKIEWTGVDQLTNWRFGMANAVAVEIPAPLFDTIGPRALAWQARAPFVPFASKMEAARKAAVMGVFSSQTLVDLYAGAALGMDPVEFVDSPGDLLRRCYVGSLEERLDTLRKIWGDAEDDQTRYAAMLLTARAAAYLPPHVAFEGDINQIIPAMLSAGLDNQAAKWAVPLTKMEDSKVSMAWAALSLAMPRTGTTTRINRVKDFISDDDSSDGRRSRMLVAGLIGLGRLPASEVKAAIDDTGLDISANSAWSKAIALAAMRRQPGTVALLAATGMQAKSWQGIPANHLFHIVRALQQVGLESAARMIAVEAISRT